jgi:hypothetical protein
MPRGMPSSLRTLQPNWKRGPASLARLSIGSTPGYWIESVRQASFIYRYDMLSPGEKQSWQIRTGLEGKDGYPMVKKAISIGGVPGMERALGLIEEYRNADKKRAARRTLDDAGRQPRRPALTLHTPIPKLRPVYRIPRA